MPCWERNEVIQLSRAVSLTVRSCQTSFLLVKENPYVPRRSDSSICAIAHVASDIVPSGCSFRWKACEHATQGHPENPSYARACSEQRKRNVQGLTSSEL